MSNPDQTSLLRRKMETTPAPAAGSLAVTLETGCMKAMARAGFIAAGLKVSAQTVEVTDVSGGLELGDVMAEAGLIIPCPAPDEAEGYLALSPGGLTALVEKTTTGRISDGEGEPRSASTIDRLLCHGFLERFLEAWRELMEGSAHEAWLADFAPADCMIPPEIIGMSAVDVPYKIHTIEAKFDGSRAVTFWAALPQARPQAGGVAVPEETERGVEDWAKDWRAAVLESPAELEAVLCKLELTLDEVRRWAVGDQVPIPASALSSVTIGRRNGPCVATARLGQARGVRALRLNEISAQRAPKATAKAETPPQALAHNPEGFEDGAGLAITSDPS
ncbi:FliM/FliN family flagellar motor C-terminal domain-containing protein [Dinoroseobacter sp. S124A]|uniref:FliM/FliN family flagellar motor C-terminal domain-containing protein n=1 Tax=Dinoroseobacter sp. S124A TaxID=3415128 RepID=UPI003C7D6845